MTLARAPVVAGNTPWERLDSTVRQVFTVSKDDAVASEKERKRARRRSKHPPKTKPSGDQH